MTDSAAPCTELFGPSTGNGFNELQALDEDGNGWIDEGDSAWQSLGVASGGAYQSLADARIGALSLDRIATAFSLKDGTELLGALRESGIYVNEDGTPGAMQMVDLVA